MRLNIGITIYCSLIVIFCMLVMFMGAYLGIKDDFDGMQMSVLYAFPTIVIAAILNVWFSHVSFEEQIS